MSSSSTMSAEEKVARLLQEAPPEYLPRSGLKEKPRGTPAEDDEQDSDPAALSEHEVVSSRRQHSKKKGQHEQQPLARSRRSRKQRDVKKEGSRHKMTRKRSTETDSDSQEEQDEESSSSAAPAAGKSRPRTQESSLTLTRPHKESRSSSLKQGRDGGSIEEGCSARENRDLRPKRREKSRARRREEPVPKQRYREHRSDKSRLRRRENRADDVSLSSEDGKDAYESSDESSSDRLSSASSSADARLSRKRHKQTERKNLRRTSRSRHRRDEAAPPSRRRHGFTRRRHKEDEKRRSRRSDGRRRDESSESSSSSYLDSFSASSDYENSRGRRRGHNDNDDHRRSRRRPSDVSSSSSLSSGLSSSSSDVRSSRPLQQKKKGSPAHGHRASDSRKWKQHKKQANDTGDEPKVVRDDRGIVYPHTEDEVDSLGYTSSGTPASSSVDSRHRRSQRRREPVHVKQERRSKSQDRKSSRLKSHKKRRDIDESDYDDDGYRGKSSASRRNRRKKAVTNMRSSSSSLSSSMSSSFSSVDSHEHHSKRYFKNDSKRDSKHASKHTLKRTSKKSKHDGHDDSKLANKPSKRHPSKSLDKIKRTSNSVLSDTETSNITGGRGGANDYDVEYVEPRGFFSPNTVGTYGEGGLAPASSSAKKRGYLLRFEVRVKLKKDANYGLFLCGDVPQLGDTLQPLKAAAGGLHLAETEYDDTTYGVANTYVDHYSSDWVDVDAKEINFYFYVLDIDRGLLARDESLQLVGPRHISLPPIYRDDAKTGPPRLCIQCGEFGVSKVDIATAQSDDDEENTKYLDI